MDQIIKNIAEAFKVRNIITLSAYFTFFALVLTDKIEPQALVAVVTTLMGHYFGTKTIKKENQNANVQE